MLWESSIFKAVEDSENEYKMVIFWKSVLFT